MIEIDEISRNFEKVGSAERPRELQDWLNFHLYHPLARRLALRLIPTPVTPNMLSIAGGCLIVLAAIAYAWPGGWGVTLLGLLLHMGWHVLDGADGDLARLTSRASSHGEVIDGICDYAGHIVLYLVLGYLLHFQIGPLAWAIMLAAGVGRIVQANHYEVQRRQYQWWVYGTPWLRAAQEGPAGGKGVLTWLASGYLRLAATLAPGAERIDALAGALDGKAREQFRHSVRAEYSPVLRGMSLLGANSRTLVLGLSMLFGSPVYFFLYEACVLSLVLVLSIRRCQRAAERIICQTEPSSLR